MVLMYLSDDDGSGGATHFTDLGIRVNHYEQYFSLFTRIVCQDVQMSKRQDKGGGLIVRMFDVQMSNRLGMRIFGYLNV